MIPGLVWHGLGTFICYRPALGQNSGSPLSGLLKERQAQIERARRRI